MRVQHEREETTSPSGACVIPYNGKRGVVWRIKYRDAEGRQVQESVGRASDGWTEQRAQRELGKRFGAVEKGLRKPKRRTFADLADEFERVSLVAKPRKRSTLTEYRGDVEQPPAARIRDRGRSPKPTATSEPA